MITLSCKSQNPIINFPDDDGSMISGAYYKDVDNVLDQFEGTWVYSNTNLTFKIVLVKKVMKPMLNHFEDLLIGEYQVIKNGNIIFDSLSNINTAFQYEHNHSIYGNSLPTTPTPFDDYTSEKFRVSLFLEEPKMGCRIALRKHVINGVEVLLLAKSSTPLPTTLNPYVLIPDNEIYVLYRQP
jgi:hypothetical protein